LHFIIAHPGCAIKLEGQDGAHLSSGAPRCSEVLYIFNAVIGVATELIMPHVFIYFSRAPRQLAAVGNKGKNCRVSEKQQGVLSDDIHHQLFRCYAQSTNF